MKHKAKITAILLVMFVITQLIGLYVVNYYSPVRVVNGIQQNVTAPSLPYGFETPEAEEQSDYYNFFSSLLIAFVFAILLFFFLTKFKVDFILKLWFFVVVIIALGISMNAILPKFMYATTIILIFSAVLAFFKIYRPNFYVHNLTELFIYPGIAAVFVPILNVYTLIALLIAISIYDIWAVWRSGIMQKMAKYQIDKLNIFPGFFVPYASDKVKAEIRKLKNSKKKTKNKKIRINLAILGGGDIIFPIIAAGVILRTWGLIPALCITTGATLGLAYLFFFAEKKKYYPAMPYITAGIFLGMIIAWALR